MISRLAPSSPLRLVRPPFIAWIAAGGLLLLGLSWGALVLLIGLFMMLMSVAPHKSIVSDLLLPLLPHLVPAAAAAVISYGLFRQSRLAHLAGVLGSGTILAFVAPRAISGIDAGHPLLVAVVLVAVIVLGCLLASTGFYWLQPRRLGSDGP